MENRKILSFHSLRDRYSVLPHCRLLYIFPFDAERVDHAKSYNPGTVRSTEIPCIAERSDNLLKVLSNGDKTGRADHAEGYNPSTVRSTGMPYIAERSDKSFMRNRLRVIRVNLLRFLGLIIDTEHYVEFTY